MLSPAHLLQRGQKSFRLFDFREFRRRRKAFERLRYYRAFIPNKSCSVPVRRIGTLILAVLAACDFSLCIGAQVLTFRTKAWLSFAPPPCRMPLGPSQASPKLIPKEWPPPGFGIA